MKFFKTSFFVVSSILSSNGSLSYNQVPIINIEDVRQDILNAKNNPVPVEIVSQAKKYQFLVIYVGRKCFVHLNYKDFSSEAYMKTSILMSYYLSNGVWRLSESMPYYYDISLAPGATESNLIFISDNRFCGPSGDCNTYFEIDRYSNGLSKLLSYRGFNRVLFLEQLLAQGKGNDVAFHHGDTIANEFLPGDYNFSNPGFFSFKLRKEITILVDARDSINSRKYESVSIVRAINQNK